MAIGIVVGAVFNKILYSIVSDLIMPPLGLAIGSVDFKNLEFVLKQPIRDAAKQITSPAFAIRYGMFLNSHVEFFIVTFSIFMAVGV